MVGNILYTTNFKIVEKLFSWRKQFTFYFFKGQTVLQDLPAVNYLTCNLSVWQFCSHNFACISGIRSWCGWALLSEFCNKKENIKGKAFCSFLWFVVSCGPPVCGFSFDFLKSRQTGTGSLRRNHAQWN